MANSPASLNEFINEKQKELDKKKKEVKEAISNIKINELIKEPSSKYNYYEGISGIKSMWYELTSKLKHLDKKSIIKIHGSRKETFERLVFL